LGEEVQTGRINKLRKNLKRGQATLKRVPGPSFSLIPLLYPSGNHLDEFFLLGFVQVLMKIEHGIEVAMDPLSVLLKGPSSELSNKFLDNVRITGVEQILRNLSYFKQFQTI
jgi:hypothetical protein